MTLRRAAFAAGPSRKVANKGGAPLLPMSVRGRGVSMQSEKSRWGNVGCIYGFDNASLPTGNPRPQSDAKAEAGRNGATGSGVDLDMMHSDFMLPAGLRVAHNFVQGPRKGPGGAVRRSTLTDALEAKGAVIASVNNGYSDMQRAACFPAEGETNAEAAKREYWACREGAAMWDMSSFVKFRIDGPDAAAELERLCSLRVDRPVEEGKLVYCCLCNEDGGVAADITVLREGEDAFYVVAGAELLKTVLGFFRANFSPSARVRVEDVSMKVGVLHVAGPKSRAVLQAAAPLADLSNDAQPFGTARTLTLGDDPCLGGGGVRVRACRISFMGDLGWELHCPMEDLPALYRIISEAGREHGLVDAGYQCIGPLRTERMFLHWGASFRKGVDLTAAETPTELGMPIKKAPFLGREGVLSRRKAGVNKRLVSVVAKDGAGRLTGMEELRRGGEPCGFVATGSFSPGLGRAVGIAWVDRGDEAASWEWVLDGEYSFVDADGTEVPCAVTQRAAFDPEGARMRA